MLTKNFVTFNEFVKWTYHSRYFPQFDQGNAKLNDAHGILPLYDKHTKTKCAIQIHNP